MTRNLCFTDAELEEGGARMLLTPADRGPGARQARKRSAQAEGWLAAPVTELTAPEAPHAVPFGGAGDQPGGLVGDDASEIGLAEATIRAGGCFVRELPLDNTCAGAARRIFREAVAGYDVPSDLVHDGVTMASELAANTMNAHGNIEFGAQGRPVTGMPEIWLYLRQFGSGRELVCKIFDSEPGWDAGEPLPVGAAVPAGPDAVRGRGLQMVAGLSAGRWGHHLSRGRLGAWKVQGKAVWFALRMPPGSDLATSARVAPRGSRAIAELAAALADRGLGAGLVPVTEPTGDLAVLSVSTKLTVWCRGEVVWWQEPHGGYDRLPVSDLVEATERIVCVHEDLVTTRPDGEEAGSAGDQPAPPDDQAAPLDNQAGPLDNQAGPLDNQAGPADT
ncbi:MAG: hypothetical protein LBV34_26445 [Nocardiopsaceae bacterium]|jgi:hypothetical protein|nr:hypothetical protein [Nocardiopsaceae bacterium]